MATRKVVGSTFQISLSLNKGGIWDYLRKNNLKKNNNGYLTSHYQDEALMKSAKQKLEKSFMLVLMALPIATTFPILALTVVAKL